MIDNMLGMTKSLSTQLDIIQEMRTVILTMGDTPERFELVELLKDLSSNNTGMIVHVEELSLWMYKHV